MSRYRERDMSQQPDAESGWKSGSVTLTFKTSFEGTVKMIGSEEGNYRDPVLDPHSYGLWLPYGATADLLFDDVTGATLDVRVIYFRRRKKIPPFIDIITHLTKSSDDSVDESLDERSPKRTGNKNGRINPFKASSLSLGALHIDCVPDPV